MPKHYVPASVKETAFNCAHCGALASQQWYNSYINGIENSPFIPDAAFLQSVFDDKHLDRDIKQQFLDDARKNEQWSSFYQERP